MKNINDYLHFYLGAWAEVRVLHLDYPTFEDGKYVISCDIVRYARMGSLEVKPILRQLSSITEEERSEYYALVPPKPKQLFIYPVHAAFYTQWFLSKQIDVFGLIDDGLAIDKTTVKSLAK